MALPPIDKSELETMLSHAEPLTPMATLAVGDFTEEHHDHITNFLIAMDSTGFSAPFDWNAEFGESREELVSTEKLQSAELEELRKIMIAHTRIDRFVEGHLSELIASGYWAAAFARLQEITDEM